MTKDVVKLVETEVMVLAKRLHNDLDEEVFDRKATEKVELVRKESEKMVLFLKAHCQHLCLSRQLKN